MATAIQSSLWIFSTSRQGTRRYRIAGFGVRTAVLAAAETGESRCRTVTLKNQPLRIATAAGRSRRVEGNQFDPVSERDGAVKHLTALRMRQHRPRHLMAIRDHTGGASRGSVRSARFPKHGSPRRPPTARDGSAGVIRQRPAPPETRGINGSGNQAGIAGKFQKSTNILTRHLSATALCAPSISLPRNESGACEAPLGLSKPAASIPYSGDPPVGFEPAGAFPTHLARQQYVRAECR